MSTNKSGEKEEMPQKAHNNWADVDDDDDDSSGDESDQESTPQGNPAQMKLDKQASSNSYTVTTFSKDQNQQERERGGRPGRQNNKVREYEQRPRRNDQNKPFEKRERKGPSNIDEESNYYKFYIYDQKFYVECMKQEEGPYQFKINVFRHKPKDQPDFPVKEFDMAEQASFQQMLEDYSGEDIRMDNMQNSLRIYLKIKDQEKAIKCHTDFTRDPVLNENNDRAKIFYQLPVEKFYKYADEEAKKYYEKEEEYKKQRSENSNYYDRNDRSYRGDNRGQRRNNRDNRDYQQYDRYQEEEQKKMEEEKFQAEMFAKTNKEERPTFKNSNKQNEESGGQPASEHRTVSDITKQPKQEEPIRQNNQEFRNGPRNNNNWERGYPNQERDKEYYQQQEYGGSRGGYRQKQQNRDGQRRDYKQGYGQNQGQDDEYFSKEKEGYQKDYYQESKNNARKNYEKPEGQQQQYEGAKNFGGGRKQYRDQGDNQGDKVDNSSQYSDSRMNQSYNSKQGYGRGGRGDHKKQYQQKDSSDYYQKGGNDQPRLPKPPRKEEDSQAQTQPNQEQKRQVYRQASGQEEEFKKQDQGQKPQKGNKSAKNAQKEEIVEKKGAKTPGGGGAKTLNKKSSNLFAPLANCN